MILPVLLLLLLIAVDFGRVYLGYVNLQQMTRVAGGFASSHASAWGTPGNSATRTEYQNLVANDASAINCALPVDGAGKIHVPDPAFPAGFSIGDPVQISIDCNFRILTPIISSIVGATIPVSASTTYTVREGAVAEVPGGGGPILVAPVSDFVGTPVSGFGDTAAVGAYGTLDVVFTDLSKNAPTSWEWNFGDGSGLVFIKGPNTVHYTCPKLPGETCTYTVTLKVGSAGGFDTETKTDYITVTVPPATGPIAEFSGTPRSGTNPLSVAFNFIDKRAGTVTYSGYAWDFGDGQTGIGASATHSYAAPGNYTVALTVTEAGTGATNTQTKVNYIVVARKVCKVPDFSNVQRKDAQDLWTAAGFSTLVQFMPGSNNYKIHQQAPTGGIEDPQPLGCDTVVTVGP